MCEADLRRELLYSLNSPFQRRFALSFTDGWIASETTTNAAAASSSFAELVFNGSTNAYEGLDSLFGSLFGSKPRGEILVRAAAAFFNAPRAHRR